MSTPQEPEPAARPLAQPLLAGDLAEKNSLRLVLSPFLTRDAWVELPAGG